MTVSGTTTDTIAVENNASGSTITSGVKANVSLNADAKVSLEKGAEGSAVKTGSEAVKADVTNNTSEKVTLTDASGKDLSIAPEKPPMKPPHPRARAAVPAAAPAATPAAIRTRAPKSLTSLHRRH